MNEVAKRLLRKVLMTCRAKSSIHKTHWETLKQEIKDYVADKDIVIAPIPQRPMLPKYLSECQHCKVMTYKLKQANALVATYRAREAAIIKVTRRSIINDSAKG